MLPCQLSKPDLHSMHYWFIEVWSGVWWTWCLDYFLCELQLQEQGKCFHSFHPTIRNELLIPSLSLKKRKCSRIFRCHWLHRLWKRCQKQKPSVQRLRVSTQLLWTYFLYSESEDIRGTAVGSRLPSLTAKESCKRIGKTFIPHPIASSKSLALN